jgi:membrane associated rhomboid family serine protease
VIPIGDNQRSRTTPFVTWGIILLNVAVFLYMLSLTNTLTGTRRQIISGFNDQTNGVCYGFETDPTEANRFVCEWAFQPKEWFDSVSGDGEAQEGALRILVTIVTSMFLQGGWLHIGGNMLFLWVFGDNVEDRLGHLKYLVFYLVTGIVAALVQGFINPDSIVPVLGASGAVAGVLGAYIVYFPRATVRVIIPFFILIFIPIPLPAFIMIGLWFLQNLFAGYATIADAADPGGGVAWFAHIGGFILGMVVAFLYSGRRTRVRNAPRWDG